jgi:copper(I)-binding protein
MNRSSRFLVAVALSVAALAAHAHSFQLGELTIGHPYARATAPGQPAGGAYLSINNAGGAADKLVSATADVAASVELHEMKMEGNVMRMREVPGIDVPAGKAVALKPGGLHIMLMGLKAPLKQGEKFPLKLTFEKAGEVTVTVNVEGPGASHDMKH